MKREELLIGAAIYASIIAAGNFKPFLKDIETQPWGGPIVSWALGYFQPLFGAAPSAQRLGTSIFSRTKLGLRPIPMNQKRKVSPAEDSPRG
jgi:hypothetical protein